MANNLKDTLVKENVYNFVLAKAYEINAMKCKADFASRSKDGYALRSLNTIINKKVGEFKASIDMAMCCGYEVEWRYVDNLIVIDEVKCSSDHDLISCHHYYEKETEGLSYGKEQSGC